MPRGFVRKIKPLNIRTTSEKRKIHDGALYVLENRDGTGLETDPRIHDY